MTDFHIHADADKTFRQMRSDRGAAGHFHMQDHHRGAVDLGHVRHEMSDRHFRRHGHDFLGGHAGRHPGERVHVFLVAIP